MGLIRCIDCGAMVSDRAKACPHCGGPIDEQIISRQQQQQLARQQAQPARQQQQQQLARQQAQPARQQQQQQLALQQAQPARQQQQPLQNGGGLTKQCPNCHRSIGINLKFCNYCGAKQSTTTAAAAGSASQPQQQSSASSESTVAHSVKRNYIKIGKHYRFHDRDVYEYGVSPGVKGVFGVDAICFKDEEIYLNSPNEYCFVEEMAFVKNFDYYDMAFGQAIFEDAVKGAYHKTRGWSHNDILEESRNFIKAFPEFAHLDPEEIAYKVFCDAAWSILYYQGADSWIGNSFLDAAKELMKNT